MKIGLLPLYIKLYDDVDREHYRPALDPFYARVAKKFEDCGIEVVTSEFCRLKEEFDAAVQSFEENDVDCIVTLHMAYSPSLESAEALTKTELPIVVLDATETYDFSDQQDSRYISFCHGIHGVMDMCNLLRRGKKAYAIAAGHFDGSDVIDRCIGYIKAAKAAKALKGSKVGSIGGSFDGMGDFLVTSEEMKDTFETEIVYGSAEELAAMAAAMTDKEIAAEVESYKNDYEMMGDVTEETMRNTARSCLAVRKWIAKYGLSAFSANFLKIGNSAGINVMPFIEACKQMANGVGYAGEGDVLTASMVGALLQGYKDTSFVEIFCPDWKGNTLFISHMGEMNANLYAAKPEMKEVNFIYGKDADNPVVGYACYKSGKGVFANVYRDEDGFCILYAPVTVTAETTDHFKGNIRGWLKPEMRTDEFLEKISYAGATHHSVLVYDARPEEIAFFGKILGLKVVGL